MLRIRLRRVGKKGKPSYRIVVAEVTSPRDGRYLEWIGNYDPMADPPAISLKEDRAVKWLQQGAQPSDAVKRILDKNGILQRTLVYKTSTRSSAVEVSEAAAPTVSVVAVASADVAAPAAEAEEPVADIEETVAEAEDQVDQAEEPVAEAEEAVDQVEEPVAEVEEPVDQVEEPVAEAEEPVAEAEELNGASQDEAAVDESSDEALAE